MSRTVKAHIYEGGGELSCNFRQFLAHLGVFKNREKILELYDNPFWVARGDNFEKVKLSFAHPGSG